MMYRLCMSALSMRTIPCTSVKSNRRQGNPTFRTKNNEQFIYQYSVAQEINPHHPVQVYSPLTTAGPSRASSLALVLGSVGAPRTRYIQSAAPPVFPCSIGLLTRLRSPSVYRRTDTSTNLAVIRPTARSFKTCRYIGSLSKCARPIRTTTSCFVPCPVSTALGRWYLPSLYCHCQQKKQKYHKTKI